jgi:Stealth protein CR2, conserved region 2
MFLFWYKKKKMDLVMTYVNGSDQAYVNKKGKYITALVQAHNPSVRHEDLGEISWAIKSILKYIPWIRTIYVITDSQAVPVSDPKVVVIDHTAIIPPQYLPTFNSDVIESYMHLIPNLSEIFLYDNDDTFHLDHIAQHDIYEPRENLETMLKIKSRFNLNILLNKATEYSKRLCLSGTLLLDKYPQIELVNNHHTKVLRKSTLGYLEKEHQEWLEPMRLSKFRGDNYIQYLFVALSVDQYLHNNQVSYDFNEVAEVHLGNKKYEEGFFERYKSKKLKFVCFNSMDSSYKEAFEKFMGHFIP